MDEMKSKIAALAKLDKTPDEIMAEKRARFELENAGREKWNKSWWRRFAAWRLDALREDEYGTFLISLSFVYTSTLMALIALIILTIVAKLAAETIALLVLGRVSVHMSRATDEDNLETGKPTLAQLGRHLLRYLVLPIMPFLRIADLLIFQMEKRTPGRFDRQPVTKEETRLCLSSELVPAYYADGIEQARTELLGKTSELRVTAADLDKRLERVDGQIGRLNVRINQAIGDATRAEPLAQAAKALGERRSRINAARKRVRETIARTSAILDECKVAVSKLRGPLEDAILIGEIELESEGDATAITNAHLAVEAHVQNVRSRIIRLATTITNPTFTLPAAEQEESLDEYFARVDRVADKVNAI